MFLNPSVAKGIFSTSQMMISGMDGGLNSLVCRTYNRKQRVGAKMAGSLLFLTFLVRNVFLKALTNDEYETIRWTIIQDLRGRSHIT